jgi:hypothetical protein
MIDIILKPIRSLLGLNFVKAKVEIKCEDDKCVLVVDKKDEIFSVEDIYTPLSVAKEEIWRRWNNKELRRKVEEFLGDEFPEILSEEPKSVLFRFIATPNFEFRRFFDLSQMINLNPVYAEFLDDKFCTRNQDKMCLGKIVISNGENKKKKNIINFQDSDNKKFSSIEILGGKKMVDFHHEIFSKLFKDVQNFDVSRFKTNGETPKDVYVKFLSLFLCNGVLFENYISKDAGYEKEFTNTVVLPAIREVFERFNVMPLIVPLLPISAEDQIDWMWYPQDIEECMDNFCK